MKRKICSNWSQTWHAWWPNIWSFTAVKTKGLCDTFHIFYFFVAQPPSESSHFRNPWTEEHLVQLNFRQYLCIENTANAKAFQLRWESLHNGCRTLNAWLPSVSCLRPVSTCFCATCPRLDENDGTLTSIFPRVRPPFIMIWECSGDSVIAQADHSMCSCLWREYMRVMNKALKIAHLNHVLVWISH